MGNGLNSGLLRSHPQGRLILSAWNPYASLSHSSQHDLFMSRDDMWV